LGIAAQQKSKSAYHMASTTGITTQDSKKLTSVRHINGKRKNSGVPATALPRAM
jgi:hypothetical protein